MVLLRKFQYVLPRGTLFKRPHLDHEDVIHDQICNFVFYQKMESFPEADLGLLQHPRQSAM